MGSTPFVLAVAGTMLLATTAIAQQPAMPSRPQPGSSPEWMERGPRSPMGEMAGPPGAPHGGPPGALASDLLAHVAELKLTDQQVMKLAAIARHSDERRHAMRTAMDSVARTPDAMRGAMERARDMERDDIRSALAVLTLDQQADAWIMHGPAAGRPHRGIPMGGGPR